MIRRRAQGKNRLLFTPTGVHGGVGARRSASLGSRAGRGGFFERNGVCIDGWPVVNGMVYVKTMPKYMWT